jgi:hypothetical protein
VVASLSGTLAGLGHKVDNLTLATDSSDYVGLIKWMPAQEGLRNVLRDIGVTNVDITGSDRGGALAGRAVDATISHAYSTGRMVGGTGGLVGIMIGEAAYSGDGYVSGTGPRIENSFSDVDIVTTSQGGTGGLVGKAATITIVGSHATGNITDAGSVYYYVDLATREYYYVDIATGERIPMYDELGERVNPPSGAGEFATHLGGLLGVANYANISDSYATGDVFAYNGTRIGGLVGGIRGAFPSKPFPNAVTNSFAAGDVTGAWKVGGLIGDVGELMIGANALPVTVDNCYATGNVIGVAGTDRVSNYGGMIGGLVGSAAYANIGNSHATGNVTVIAEKPTNNVGGLVGNQTSGSITDSYATGTVVGNRGEYSGGLGGGSRGSGTVTDSYYQDANAAVASDMTPVRSETGRIIDDLRLNEPNTRQGNRNNTAATRNGNRSALDQYIYQDDERGYSARVRAISVEDECSDDDEDCS